MQFVDWLNEGRNTVCDKAVFFEGEKDGVRVEIALNYNDSYAENLFTFANNINTHEGGSHLSGFRAGLTRTLNNYAQANNLLKKDLKGLTGDDVRYLVPHQANLRIIDATAKRMGVTSDKIMLNISRYGNTTAATIPLCLADWESELRRGDNLVLAAFGGGPWSKDKTPL